jgi:hypothetical protein
MQNWRKWPILAAVVVLLGLSGCGSSRESTLASSPAGEASGGVLGNGKAAFDAQYGPGEDTQESEELAYTFYPADSLEAVEYVLAYFMEDAADIVSLQFKEPYLTQTQSLEIAESFLPSDRVLLEEGTESETLYTIKYQSEQLASTMEKTRFLGAEPGAFILILQHEADQPDEVFGAVIKLGDRL